VEHASDKTEARISKSETNSNVQKGQSFKQDCSEFAVLNFLSLEFILASFCFEFRISNVYVFPDSVVAGKGEDPQWLYTVRFDAQELWGADADPTVKVSIEAFEPYLEHV
jgi:hypothetical protein